MGRMLEALGHGEFARGPVASSPPPDEDFPLLTEETDVPYIEVGRSNSVDASPTVLAIKSAPRLRLVPASPGDTAPTFEPLPPASFPAAVSVSYRALPLDRGLAPPAQRFSADLVAFHQPDHAASDQYRQLATTLRLGLKAGVAHAVLCAGLHARAGTTTVVLNLAITYARQGVRVIVVDAHRVQPSIAGRLGVRARPGLVEVLEGTESLERAIQETGLENLATLTSGESDLLCSARTVGEAGRPIVRLLRDRFDLVLIDAPPYQEAGDGTGLEAACDAVFVVVPRSESDSPEMAERIRHMSERGNPVRGCILTGR